MKKTLLFMLAFCLLATAKSQTVTRLLGSSPFQDSLWAFDTAGFMVKKRLGPFPDAGGSFTGITGIARNPNSGTIYVIAKQSAVSGRMLGKLNPATGLVSLVGNLGDNFSSLTFRNDSLLGVTGNGASTPKTLYLIDTTTATPTMLTALGSGADGEIICYNPSDDMIYHWSGNTTVVFEKILPYPPYTITSIGSGSSETFGAVYISDTLFLRSNIGSSFNYWSTNNTIGADLGSAPDDIRGMVFITCTRAVTGTAAFCVGDSTVLTASAGNTYQWYRNGVLLAGETNQSITIDTVGSYNVMIDDACGTDSLAVGINVVQNSLPTVSLSSASTSFCAGDSLLLTGTSGGTSQWYLDGTAIPGAAAHTYYATAAGTYNMTKTNLSGCSDSAAVGITLTVNPLPGVNLNTADDSVCNNAGVVTLTGTPSGGTYSGAGVSGSNFDPSAGIVGNNQVFYSFTDGNSCTNTDTATIYVINCLGIPGLEQENTITVYPNPARETISINIPGYAGEKYTIVITDLSGRQVLTGSGNASYTNISVSALSDGIYHVMIKNSSTVSKIKLVIAR